MSETDINATVNVTEDIYADVDSTAMSAAVIDDGDSIVVHAEVDFGHTLDTELEDNDLIDVPVDESVGIAGDHRVLIHRDAPNQHPMSAITGLNDALAGIDTALSSRISQVEAETADLDVDMADALLRIGDLQNQVDGNITTWFYAAEPAMNLPPVAYDPSNPHDTGWDTDDKKNAHKGDLYYNTLTGYAYRFAYSDGAYGWMRITDTDVVKALADAAKAQDTADSKRRVFYTTPYPPYDKGDLWVQGGSGDILVCSTEKPADGSYDFADWSRASKYTDDTVADIALASANGKNTVYHQASQPTGGTYKKGDTWFDTDDDYTMYTYDGSLWIKEQFGNEAIADLSISNAKIKDATIEYGKIKSVDAGKITVGYLNAARIEAGSLGVGKIDATSGTFNEANIPNLNASKITAGTLDADRIGAGSIAVGKIDATSGTFNTANIPNLNASKITAGDISADRMKVNAISAINSNTGTVQISASKVDIAGAAVFNNYSTTTEMNTAIGDAVDGIEVGGRNILGYTGDFANWRLAGTYTTVSNGELSFNVSGLTSNAFNRVFGWILPNASELAGKTIVISAEIYSDDWSTVESDRGDWHRSICIQTQYTNVAKWDKTSSYAGLRYRHGNFGDTSLWDVMPTTMTNGKWHRIVSKPILLPDDLNNDVASGTGSEITIQPMLVRNGQVKFRHLKVEIGNKATDWTPAPEDVQAEIDAKKSTFTINATGTDASQGYAQILAWAQEGQQLTWTVDSTAGIKVGDTVRIKTTVANMSNAPVYVVTTCRETPTSSTSIKTTSHGLDTTIIDGGNILANSIGANQIQANSINTSKLAVGDWTNLVTANELYPDSLPTTSVVISNGYLVKKDATQQYLPLSKKTPNFFKTGDELYVEFYAKAASSTNIVFYLYGYDKNETYIDGCANAATINGSTTLTLTTSEVLYSGTITLSATQWNTAAYYLIDINNSSTTKVQIYVRKAIVRRKNEGNLIVDGAITAGKLNVNNINASKQLTVGAMTDSAQASILNSNIYIGARNLLLNTGSTGGYYANVVPSGTNLTYDATNGGYYRSASSTNEGIVCSSSVATESLVGTEYYTHTLWVKSSAARSFSIQLRKNNNGADGGGYTSNTNIALAANTWTKITHTFKGASGTFEVYARLYIAAGTSCNVYVKDWKLEKGNKATDWTPAPSDLAATATDYITHIDNDGIRIHPSSTQNNSVVINANGMEVFKGGTAAANSVAFYGDTARIGKANNGRVEVSNTAIDLYSGNTKAATVSEFTSGTGVITVYGKNSRGTFIKPAGFECFGTTASDYSYYASTFLRLGSSDDLDGIKLEKVNNYRRLYITAPDGVTTSNAFNTKAITATSITLGDHSSAVGSIVSAYLTANKAITAGTAASLCNIQLTAGVWVIVAVAQFPNGSDATYRRLKISTSSTSAEPPDVQISAHNGHPTTIQSTKIVSISSTTNYYLTVMSAKAQTILAGSVDGFNYIKAVRIV